MTLILPLLGCNEWDRAGGPLHDADGLAAFADELRKNCPENVTLLELDSHINDVQFVDCALAVFDNWLDEGTVLRP